MSAVASFLALMERQREDIFLEMRRVPAPLLWTRPAPARWCPAEHIDHTRRLLRFFRRGLRALLLLPHPLAHMSRGKPYTSSIDDVYERPRMPLNVGWMWAPQVSPDRPVPLDELETRVRSEHAAIGDLYRTYDEGYLGHIRIWDPAIGRMNLVQALRVGVYHDEHHYRIIRRQLAEVVPMNDLL